MSSADTSVTLDLSCDDDSITFLEAGVVPGRIPPFVFVNSGIKGLYDTPSSKTSLTERQTGDGAHAVIDSDVLYATRTVSIPFAVNRTAGNGLNSARTRINRMSHHSNVRLTVHDNGLDRYLTGYVVVTWSDVFWREYDSGTITLTCSDPYLYSTAVQQATLLPTTTAGYTSSDGLGLYYGKGGKGLYYPIRYGAPGQKDPSKGGTGESPTIGNQQNVADVHNYGSTAAFPLIVMSGHMNGVRIDWSASDKTYGTLAWKGRTESVPAMFDCRTHLVSMGGVDKSWQLTYRSFPHVPANGTCRIALISGGLGHVTVTSQDTWI